MKKDGKNIVSDAVTDAKALREAAFQAAKNELVESMTPALKRLLEKEIKGVLSQNEDSDRLRRGVQDNWPGESHTGFEEAKQKGEPEMDMDDKKGGKELDLESLAGFFPQMSEEPDQQEGMGGRLPGMGLGMEAPQQMQSIPTLGEGEGEEGEELEMKKEGKKDKEEEEPMDETVEISEAELKKVYESALQTEVQVKKGFSDMTPMGEIEDVVKDIGKGLNPEDKGEKTWDKGEAEDKKDWMVKEDVKSLISKGLAENKALRENNAKLAQMVRALGEKLHETNLFNAKVLHVNRILNKNGRLTTEQKKVVLEKIDKAGTIAEVKMVYETIVDTFAAATQLSESKSRKPVANAQRARTSGGADQKVLSESADHGSNSSQMTRLQQLAGLVK